MDDKNHPGLNQRKESKELRYKNVLQNVYLEALQQYLKRLRLCRWV